MKQHISGLTGIRGLAVLAVVAYHVAPDLVPFGSVGVTVFFVLSGFLITGLMLKEREEHGALDFFAFYVRRLIRLAPALITAIIGGGLLLWAFRDPQLTSTYPGEALVAFLYLGDITQPFGMDMPVIGHTWSLAVEEQFYMVWPLLLMFLVSFTRGDRRRLVYVIASLAGLALAWRVYLAVAADTWERAYFAPDANAYALLLGCVLGALPGLKRAPKFMLWGSLVLLAALCVLPLDSHSDDGRRLQVVIGTVSAIVAVGLVWAAPRAGRLLENKPLVWVGNISYGWYLWHQIIWHIHPNGNEPSGMIPHAIAAGVSLVPTVLSYYMIERPISKKLKPRFERDRPASKTSDMEPSARHLAS
ncbi:acyltransferase family protein [Arthrobacter sp. 2MCAF15]|uniref:acyltransferase family protein n=1 Tax=Arthrobacter sp. 2MCAF15 TaxID=3232984 RepID=UPI003F8EA840